MASLPTPGASDGVWGSQLNEFLGVAHSAAGLANAHTYGFAVGTANISNTTGSYADMSDMSVTLTTSGHPVLILFSAPITLSASSVGYFQVVVDSTATGALCAIENISASATKEETAFVQYITTLAAGSHTIKLQWQDASGTIAQNIGSRTLSVLEL